MGNEVAEHREYRMPAEWEPHDREIVGIGAVALIEHGGALGCVTQQQPLGRGGRIGAPALSRSVAQHSGEPLALSGGEHDTDG